MKNSSNQENLKIYEETFAGFKKNFIDDLEFMGKGKKLLHVLSNKNQDVEFLLNCHNLITHEWRSRIYKLSTHYLDDMSKWCIYYDGSLLHNAVLDDSGNVCLSGPENFKLGNTKRHAHKLFDVDTDYFLFYKIFGKYLYLEKQGLDNQIWTKEHKEMIIELKRTKLELDQYKKGLL